MEAIYLKTISKEKRSIIPFPSCYDLGGM